MLVKFYTRNGCPLCDKGKKVIMELKEQWNFQYEEHDIDQSDDLTERYGLMIPVVEIDGEEVQFGIIDKSFINEALTKKNAVL